MYDLKLTHELINVMLNSKVIEKVITNKTLTSYKTCVNKILGEYDDKNIDKMLKKNNDVIFQKCLNYSKELSTQKTYLCAFVKIFRWFDFPVDVIKKYSEKIKSINKELTLKIKVKNQTEEKLNIDDAYVMVDNIMAKFDEHRKQITKTFDEHARLTVMAYLFLKHGVLRGDELMSIMIMDNDEHEHDNYFNVTSKKLHIKKHKTVKSHGEKVINMLDEILCVLDLGIGERLFKTKKGADFKTSKQLSAYVKKHFGEDIYTFRKAITSIVITSEDQDELEKLCYYQGHSVNTQLDFYLKYV